jgi:hypothetical protein
MGVDGREAILYAIPTHRIVHRARAESRLRVTRLLPASGARRAEKRVGFIFSFFSSIEK